ncbi:MAG: hydrolase of the alpha/beta superfamily [Labilithrix sp.]|nr:hydrolase of the alpha/beta superfamily [Labilithrix sp.]
MCSRSPSARERVRKKKSQVHAPRASYEELEVRTEDGVALRAVVDDPPDGVALLGTCVMAHAMFARKTEFGRRDRKGLAHAYAAAGWRTIAFDFRGHGESTLQRGTAEWGYDDLVRHDLPAVVGCARARSDGKPVVVVGHSLGGHVALAAQGTGRLEADGILAIAANVWIRELETSRVRWAAKLALGRVMRESVLRIGRLPARSMRIGSDDASGRFVRDILRFMGAGQWRSYDGRDDYLASLSRVDVPVCAVSSDGDLLTCHPASAEAFARRCSGPLHMVRITRSDDARGRRAPGHMEIVTGEGGLPKLLAALAWIESELASTAPVKQKSGTYAK